VAFCEHFGPNATDFAKSAPVLVFRLTASSNSVTIDRCKKYSRSSSQGCREPLQTKKPTVFGRSRTCPNFSDSDPPDCILTIELSHSKTEETIMRKPLVVTAVGVALLSLVALVALAASSKSSYSFSHDGRTVTAHNESSFVTPTNHDGKLKTIAGNLSIYPYGVFFCCFGNTIAAGPPNFPFQYWIAIPFTPAADATITRVEASVGTFGGADAGPFSLRSLLTTITRLERPSRPSSSAVRRTMEPAALSTPATTRLALPLPKGRNTGLPLPLPRNKPPSPVAGLSTART